LYETAVAALTDLGLGAIEMAAQTLAMITIPTSTPIDLRDNCKDVILPENTGIERERKFGATIRSFGHSSGTTSNRPPLQEAQGYTPLSWEARSMI
jgi:hypothetical protein